MSFSERYETLEHFNSLTDYNRNTNENYIFLVEALNDKECRGASLEGSSRSGKTWSSVDLIIHICTSVEEKCTINIYRETYNEFKTTLYDDFKRRLPDFGLDNPFARKREIDSFKIGENTIHFLGDGKQGGGCDYAFFNEIMEIQKRVFDDVEMRCRKFWWADYNPSKNEHWFFDNVENRPDVKKFHSTFNMNPFISDNEKSKILSYEPWLPGSYEIVDGKVMYKGRMVTEKNQAPRHPVNCETGTADLLRWMIYGLGLKAEKPNRIFNWKEIPVNEFIALEARAELYGADWGKVDPFGIIHVKYYDGSLYVRELNYLSENELRIIYGRRGAMDQDLQDEGIIKRRFNELNIPKNKVIVCDNNRKEKIRALRQAGWEYAVAVVKNQVIDGISLLSDLEIYFTDDSPNLKSEQEMYSYKTDRYGIILDSAEDKGNHLIDPLRYAAEYLRKQGIINIV